jgi:HSP20 family protein
MEQTALQNVPVRMWRQKDRLTIAAPMPGLEPEDITVAISADGRLTLHGELRGVFKHDKDVMLNEWSVGGYHRELDLPDTVNAELANLTFGNGVLVIVLPIAKTQRPADLTLEGVGQARGQRVGHSGSNITPHSTGEHQDAMADQHHRSGSGA